MQAIITGIIITWWYHIATTIEFDITFCRTNTQSNEVEIQRIEHSDITKKTEARGDDVIDDANDDDKAVSDEVKEHEMSTCPAAHDTQK